MYNLSVYEEFVDFVVTLVNVFCNLAFYLNYGKIDCNIFSKGYDYYVCRFCVRVKI